MKKLLLFLSASIFVMTCGAAPKPGGTGSTGTTNKSALTAPAGACFLLDAQTIKDITGLNITEIKPNGDSCLYVDPTAPVNGFAQTLAGLLGGVFGAGATSAARPSGAGIIVREPKDAGDLSNVNVPQYAQSQLSQVQIPAQAGCGSLQSVSGLNAASIVCLSGAIGHGGVVQNGKLVLITFLAPGTTATDDIMGKLLGAAAAKM